MESPEELAAQIELAAQAELAEQVELIKDLAPSYRAVKDRKDGPMFLGRLFDLWFIRWHLKLQDYGGSEEALEDARAQKKGVRAMSFMNHIGRLNHHVCISGSRACLTWLRRYCRKDLAREAQGKS